MLERKRVMIPLDTIGGFSVCLLKERKFPGDYFLKRLQRPIEFETIPLGDMCVFFSLYTFKNRNFVLYFFII